MKKYKGAEIGVRTETQGGLIMAYIQRGKMGKREALRTTGNRGIFFTLKLDVLYVFCLDQQVAAQKPKSAKEVATFHPE